MLFRRFVTSLIVVLALVFAMGPMGLSASAAAGHGHDMMAPAAAHAPCDRNETRAPAPCMVAGGCLMLHAGFAAPQEGAALAVQFDHSTELLLPENRPLAGIISPPPFKPPRTRS